MSDGTSRSAGHVYVELISSQLAEERAAKTSLEQRGAQVVTWAGGLVAASVALLEVVPDDTPVATVAILVAALLLVVTAVVATRVIRPADFVEANLGDLRRIIESSDFMGAEEQIGLRRTSELALTILEKARKASGAKARRLQNALSFLAAAAGALAIAVAAIAYSILFSGG